LFIIVLTSGKVAVFTAPTRDHTVAANGNLVREGVRPAEEVS